jgi:hypothetical protein
VSFAVIILCVASQRVVPKVSVYFVIDSVRKLLYSHSYHENFTHLHCEILSNRLETCEKCVTFSKARGIKSKLKASIVTDEYFYLPCAARVPFSHMLPKASFNSHVYTK